MSRRIGFAIVGGGSIGAAILAACFGDDPSVAPKDGGGGEAGDDQATAPPPVSQAPGDSGADAPITATYLARFDLAQGELPYGLTIATNGGDPIVGFAPTGRFVDVAEDGGYSTVGSFTSFSNALALGMAADPAFDGTFYAKVASAGSPPPYIYRVVAAGNTSFVGSSVPASNRLEFIGNDAYVTDATGSIFIRAPGGTIQQWVSDPRLAGDPNDCKLGAGFPSGANGIAHDANNVYVVNIDKALFLQIPRETDGGPGTVMTLSSDRALCGADGIVRDVDGSFLLANSAKDAIQRVSADGKTVSTFFAGPPLDGPASLVIETTATGRRLLVTNSALSSAKKIDAGVVPRPALLSIPLP